jgi:Xaa-Pro aminopeptidase
MALRSVTHPFGPAVLKQLRTVLQQHSIEAIVIPSSDAHNSEYVAERFKYRGNVSNFHGSAGTALVTQTGAFLWTDGRYWLEAEGSLFAGWTLMRDGRVDTPTLEDWVPKSLDGGRNARVGVNASLVTIGQWERWAKKFAPVDLGPRLIEDSIDAVEGGPNAALVVPSSSGRVFPRPAQFDGQTTQEKLADVIRLTREKHTQADVLVVTALDEIAWLTNLRGDEVPYNPVFYAYALVYLTDDCDMKATMFCSLEALAVEARERVRHLELLEYNTLLLSPTPLAQLEGRVVVLDENQTSYGLQRALREVHRVSDVQLTPLSPVSLLKARKHAVEIEGFKQSHIRDGVALTRYLAWLTRILRTHDGVDPKTGLRVSEYSGAEVLESYRRQEDHFVQLSFGTISGSGANGAIIHYSPSKDTSSAIAKDALYLVDSGAQYYDGTTDVTRTVCFDVNSVTEEEREAYTLVLKGHIAIQRCVWPKGTTGHRLDAFARQALWTQGLNYAHGTGHGVGSFLNVHEGPQGMGIRPTVTGAPLEASMILSNEPGYYKDGSFGIRIENLELIVPAVTKYNNGDFLTFETLTVAPLCRDLIDVALLNADEVAWVNRYHDRVRATLAPLVEAKKTTTTTSGESGMTQEEKDETIAYLNYHCAHL